jgi:hypothetical protein
MLNSKAGVGVFQRGECVCGGGGGVQGVNGGCLQVDAYNKVDALCL